MHRNARCIWIVLFLGIARVAVAADHAVLDRLFRQGSYAEIKTEAVKSISDDPNDELSLDFLRKADDALKTEKEAMTFFGNGEYDKAMILFLKLRTVSPDADRIVRIMSDAESKRLAHEKKSFEDDLSRTTRLASMMFESGETDKAEELLRVLELKFKASSYASDLGKASAGMFALKGRIADRKRQRDLAAVRSGIVTFLNGGDIESARKALTDGLYRFGEKDLHDQIRAVDDAEKAKHKVAEEAAARIVRVDISSRSDYICRQIAQGGFDKARMAIEAGSKKYPNESCFSAARRDLAAAEKNASRAAATAHMAEIKKVKSDADDALRRFDISAAKNAATLADQLGEKILADDISRRLRDLIAARTAEIKQRAAQKADEIRRERERKIEEDRREQGRKAEEERREQDRKAEVARREQDRKEKEDRRQQEMKAEDLRRAQEAKVAEEIAARDRNAKAAAAQERAEKEAAAIAVREKAEVEARERKKADEAVREKERRYAQIRARVAERARRVEEERRKAVVIVSPKPVENIVHVPVSDGKDTVPEKKDIVRHVAPAAPVPVIDAAEGAHRAQERRIAEQLEALKDAVAFGDETKSDVAVAALERTFVETGAQYPGAREVYRALRVKAARVKERAQARREKEAEAAKKNSERAIRAAHAEKVKKIQSDAAQALRRADLSGLKNAATAAEGIGEKVLADDISCKLRDVMTARTTEIKKRAARKAAEIRREQEEKVAEIRRRHDEQAAEISRRQAAKARAEAAERERSAKEAAEKERAVKEAAEVAAREKSAIEAEDRKKAEAVRREKERRYAEIREKVAEKARRADEESRSKAVAETKATKSVERAPKITYVPAEPKKIEGPVPVMTPKATVEAAKPLAVDPAIVEAQRKKERLIAEQLERLKDAVALDDDLLADRAIAVLESSFADTGAQYAGAREQYRTLRVKAERIKEKALERRRKDELAVEQKRRSDYRKTTEVQFARLLEKGSLGEAEKVLAECAGAGDAFFCDALNNDFEKTKRARIESLQKRLQKERIAVKATTAVPVPAVAAAPLVPVAPVAEKQRTSQDAARRAKEASRVDERRRNAQLKESAQRLKKVREMLVRRRKEEERERLEKERTAECLKAEESEKKQVFLKRLIADFSSDLASSNIETAQQALIKCREAGVPDAEIIAMTERLNAVVASLEERRRKETEAAIIARKSAEEERIRAQRQKDAEIVRRKYLAVLSDLKHAVEKHDDRTASELARTIKATYQTDEEYDRLDALLHVSLQRQEELRMSRQRQHLDDMRREKAEADRLGVALASVSALRTDGKFEEALAALDALRPTVMRPASRKEIDRAVSEVTTAYNNSRREADRKREQVFSEQRISFDTALAAGDCEKAQRILTLLKTVYADLPGARERIAAADIALHNAQTKAAEVARSRLFAAAVKDFEDAFAADDIVGARKCLSALLKQYGDRGDFKEQSQRLSAREKSFSQERDREKERQFDENVRSAQASIASQDFLSAKIAMEEMKDRFLSDRRYAKRLSDLEEMLKKSAYRYEKDALEKQFSGELSAVRASVVAGDLVAARMQLSRLNAAYPDFRSRIAEVERDVRVDEQRMRDETIRKRDDAFTRQVSEISRTADSGDFDAAMSLLQAFSAEYGVDRAYVQRVASVTDRITAQRAAFLRRRADEQFNAVISQAQESIRQNDPRRAKEVLLALGSEFSARAEVVDLLVRAERALIEERTQQKERIKRQVQQIRSRKNGEDERSLSAQQTIMQARLSDGKIRIERALASDDFSAAYAVLDELKIGLDARLLPMLDPLVKTVDLAERTYSVRVREQRRFDAERRFKEFDAAVDQGSYFRSRALLDALVSDFGADDEFSQRCLDSRKRLNTAAEAAQKADERRAYDVSVERVETLISRGLITDAEKALNELAAQYGEDNAVKKLRKDIYRSASAQNKG